VLEAFISFTFKEDVSSALYAFAAGATRLFRWNYQSAAESVVSNGKLGYLHCLTGAVFGKVLRLAERQRRKVGDVRQIEWVCPPCRRYNSKRVWGEAIKQPRYALAAKGPPSCTSFRYVGEGPQEADKVFEDHP
jgi:hypothetical protein